MRSFISALRRTGRTLDRFRKADGGVTAIEFGVVAAPFLLLVFAILETALIFFAQQLLDTGVENASRRIRTGIAQQQGFSASQFKSSICDIVGGLLNCNGISLDVRTYATFDAINLNNPLDASGNLNTAGFTYNPGHGTDIVTVRAFYQWGTFTNLMGLNFSDMPNGKRLLASAAAFRNEPFPW